VLLQELSQYLPRLMKLVFNKCELEDQEKRQLKLLFGQWLRGYYLQLRIGSAFYKYQWKEEEMGELDELQSMALDNLAACMRSNARMVRISCKAKQLHTLEVSPSKTPPAAHPCIQGCGRCHGVATPTTRCVCGSGFLDWVLALWLRHILIALWAQTTQIARPRRTSVCVCAPKRRSAPE